jgi:hypothetical protein
MLRFGRKVFGQIYLHPANDPTTAEFKTTTLAFLKVEETSFVMKTHQATYSIVVNFCSARD